MKNLSKYRDPENIGSVHWFRTMLEYIEKSNQYIMDSHNIMCAIHDLREWQETGKPLFGILPCGNSGDIYNVYVGGWQSPNEFDTWQSKREAMAYRVKNDKWFKETDEIEGVGTINTDGKFHTCTEAKGNNSVFDFDRIQRQIDYLNDRYILYPQTR